jgi:ABC-2 type transport system ATP-binding protein
MIEIQNVSFHFKKNEPIFQNLSLMLHEGGIYGILGKNGVGKSTLLRMMAGLLFPENGSVFANGQETKHRNVSFLQELYLLPEEFDTPAISIANYVKSYAPFYPHFNYEQYQSYIAEFQLDTTAQFSSLSLGQKKKAFISFALATNTKLLLMDEPTNGLDIPSKSQFRKIIASVATDDKIIVISTHQIRDLQSLIDPIIILDKNGVVFNASMQEISEKITQKNTSESELIADALYAESSLKGHSILTKNTENEDSKIDLELLFNACETKPEVFKNIFTKQNFQNNGK